jgi:hypothetical protein
MVLLHELVRRVLPLADAAVSVKLTSTYKLLSIS